jgi:deazaflavin-dependent oxidoreductase (nitroreductase family)
MVRRLPIVLTTAPIPAPIPLLRYGGCWLIGPSIALLEHRCRHTGKRRHTLLKVVHREPGCLMVISCDGPHAPWYRDIQADPHVRISSGGIRRASAIAVRPSGEHGAAILEGFRCHHPLTARLFGRVFGVPEFTAGRAVPACRAEQLPLVRISSCEAGHGRSASKLSG